MTPTHHSIPVPGGALPLTVVTGRGDGPALVIAPSAFGVTPDLEQQMAELALSVRRVVALDLTFRHDPGPAAYDDMARVMARVRSIDLIRAGDDLAAALAWAGADGAPVVALGICLGGLLALGAAAEGRVAGVVTWHGTRLDSLFDRAAAMRCPLRLHFGGVDPFVPPSVAARAREVFAGRDDVDVQVHAGATHGYSHRAAPAAYDAAAERAGMHAVRELAAAVAATAR